MIRTQLFSKANEKKDLSYADITQNKGIKRAEGRDKERWRMEETSPPTAEVLAIFTL
jgi:hypothetical protein